MERVLVVDAEARILRFTELTLKSSGYDVVTATSGCEAIELTHSAKPDIIILDTFTDGLELLKKLRSFSDIPIIVFSAKSRIGDKAIDSGANDFLAKPFKPEELIKRIEALLPLGG